MCFDQIYPSPFLLSNSSPVLYHFPLPISCTVFKPRFHFFPFFFPVCMGCRTRVVSQRQYPWRKWTLPSDETSRAPCSCIMGSQLPQFCSYLMHAVTTCVSLYMQWSCHGWQIGFYCRHPIFLVLSIFLFPLLWESLSLGDLIYSQALKCLIFSMLSLLLFIIYCKKKPLWWGLRDALICKIIVYNISGIKFLPELRWRIIIMSIIKLVILTYPPHLWLTQPCTRREWCLMEGTVNPTRKWFVAPIPFVLLLH